MGVSTGGPVPRARWVVAGTTIATMLLATVAAAVPATAQAPAEASGGEVTELIVAYDPGVPPSEAPGVATGASAIASDDPATDLQTGEPIGFGLRTVALGRPLDAAEAQALADELSQAPGIRYAEPNGVVILETVQPNAPWGLDRIDTPTLPLDGTYQYDSSGSGVTAYVIDSGIRASHTEFAGRVSPGFNNAPDAQNTVNPANTDDCNGHGTHVAGTIAGATYGVAKQATLIPVRVFGCTGSTTIDAVIQGVQWVATHHTGGPAVANMSLSSGLSQAMNDAVAALVADGVTVAVASGNSATDSCTRSPASEPTAITVNASDSADGAASFSDFGSCSDIYAPGVDIPSAWWTSDSATNTISGTSMAAPHVAGAAARLLGGSPSLTPAQVWSALSSAASNITFAPGSGDPDRLLYVNPGVVVTRPGAPRSVTATAGTTSAVVSWLAPTSNGGSAVTSYTARAWSLGVGGAIAKSCQPSPLTELSCTITGLTNATTYYIDVVASNVVGDGDASTPREATSLTAGATAPSEPRSVTVVAGNGAGAVSWQAPASDGGSSVTSYRARAWDAAVNGNQVGTCQPSPLTGLSCTITGLTNGTTYYVDVTATNGTGTSSPSPRVPLTPAAVPGAPRTVTAAGSATSGVVSWQAPTSNGGSAITAYTARAWTGATDGSIAATCQPTPLTGLGCTITGLTNGTTYYVDVVATNAVGTGPASATRLPVTPAASAPPASGGGGGGGSSSSSGGSSSPGGGGGGSIWTVKEVRPAFGSVSGGSRVLVLGWGFTGATGVSVGGTLAPAFTFINDATIEIVTPPGTLGWQELRVWLPNGSVPAMFEYRSEAAAQEAAPIETPPAATVGVVPVGPATSPIVRPTAGATTAITSLRRAPARTAAKAPVVRIATGVPLHLRVPGLPSSAVVRATLRIGGQQATLGRSRTTTRGAVTLPTFIALRPGSYLMTLTPAGGTPRYVTVQARQP